MLWSQYHFDESILPDGKILPKVSSLFFIFIFQDFKGDIFVFFSSKVLKASSDENKLCFEKDIVCCMLVMS